MQTPDLTRTGINVLRLVSAKLTVVEIRVRRVGLHVLTIMKTQAFLRVCSDVLLKGFGPTSLIGKDKCLQ